MPDLVEEVDRARAIELALDAASGDDLLLIAGKGHEQTQNLAGVEIPFSDVALVRGKRDT